MTYSSDTHVIFSTLFCHLFKQKVKKRVWTLTSVLRKHVNACGFLLGPHGSGKAFFQLLTVNLFRWRLDRDKRQTEVYELGKMHRYCVYGTSVYDVIRETCLLELIFSSLQTQWNRRKIFSVHGSTSFSLVETSVSVNQSILRKHNRSKLTKILFNLTEA